MAKLTDLPTEILELIYHFLGSIDDVHHLGRTCKTTGHVTRLRSVYVEIMRSVIYCSPQHRHDYQLNSMIRLHQDIVAFIEQHNMPLPATAPPNRDLNPYERQLPSAVSPNPGRAAFSDLDVYDILARYQGLRVLQDIWLERQLEVEDYLSATYDHVDGSVYDRYTTLVGRDDEFQEGRRPKRYSRTGHTRFYTSLNSNQRDRFHAAVVRVWLLNEIRWVLTNFMHPGNFANQLNILEMCKSMIASGQDAPLMDKLDEFSVFTFMYQHLLPRHIAFLADRDPSKVPLTFVTEYSRDRVYWSRLFRTCFMAGQTYFQPPDLIDLALRSRLSRKAPYPSMEMPESSEKWRLPLGGGPQVPPGSELSDQGAKPAICNALDLHNRIISRCSFHQDRYNNSQVQIIRAGPNHGYMQVPDYARAYFVDQALLAFERHEIRGRGLADVRRIFESEWIEVQWEIWWWADNEDKARMKMERWRESEGAGVGES